MSDPVLRIRLSLAAPDEYNDGNFKRLKFGPTSRPERREGAIRASSLVQFEQSARAWKMNFRLICMVRLLPLNWLASRNLIDETFAYVELSALLSDRWLPAKNPDPSQPWVQTYRKNR